MTRPSPDEWKEADGNWPAIRELMRRAGIPERTIATMTLAERPTDRNLTCARAVIDFRKRRAEGILPREDNFKTAYATLEGLNVSEESFIAMTQGKKSDVNKAIRWLEARG